MNIYETLSALLRALELTEQADRVDAYAATRADDYDGEPLPDEELDAILADLITLSEDDDVHGDVLVAAADVADEVRADQGQRAEQAEQDERDRAEAAARLRGETAQGDDGDDDGDDGSEGDDGDGSTDAEGQTGDETGDGTEGDDGDGSEGDGADDRTPALVAGGASRRNLRARRQRNARPQAPAEPDASEIVWGDHAPGVTAGTLANDVTQIDRAMERRWYGFRRSPSRGREELQIASVRARFPEERRLVDGEGDLAEALSPTAATRRIQAQVDSAIDRLMAEQSPAAALTAAGGLCTLPTPIYNVPGWGSVARPIRDQALVSFLASRGGVVDLTPPTLPDLAGAVSLWTVQNDEDAAGDDGPVKPCLRVTCGEQRPTNVDAIPLCLTYGNFLARTYGELTTAWSNLANVAHARFAEAVLIAQMITLSTSVSAETTEWSATRDFLETLSRAAWGMRSRHRLDDNFPFIAVFPSVVWGIIQTDISRQMPGGSTAENMAVAAATVRNWLAARGIVPVPSPDMNVIGQQAASTPLADWPPVIDWLVYPAGTFLHLDGGELNLGVVRDSTLNAVNDFQTFSETFEAVHMAGIESIHGTLSVCPSGATSGTIDPAPFCASYT